MGKEFPLAITNWEKRFAEGWGDKQKPEPRLMAFFEKYGQELGDNASILDIGSGEGRHLVPLAEQGWNITGVEPTQTGIALTQEKLKNTNTKVTLVRGDFHHLPFVDNSFDCIISSQAMQYNNWEGASQTIQEATRVLKPGGYFFLRVRSDQAELKPTAHILPADKGRTWTEQRGEEKSLVTVHDYSYQELQELAQSNSLEFVEEPVDEKSVQGDIVAYGQWNVIFRKNGEIKNSSVS